MSSQLAGTTDVKIEEVTTDDNPGNRKKPRTIITIYQKEVLEAHFKRGMDSAALRLQHLHDAAAEETGQEQP